MCAAFGDVCSLASDLICVHLYYCDISELLAAFSVICQCASLVFILFFFYGKKFDLNTFVSSARLSVFCAFILDVEICFQCFDSVGWSSGRMLAYSLNVCLYISDRLRVFGCSARCAINTALCWESDVCEILALTN